MPQFLSVASNSLVEALEAELIKKQFKVVKKSSLGVYFQGNWDECLRAQLSLNIPSRILLPTQVFTAYKPEELYTHILKHDYTKYISPKQNFMVESSIQQCSFKDSQFLSLKVKDAIVDQFRTKFGGRPSVSKSDYQLRVVVKGLKNSYSVFLDTTGGFLFERGYRKDTGPAPLKENIAASLVQLSGWDGEKPFVDLMCGSGTLPIEAALFALNKSMLTQKMFSFQEWGTMVGRDWSDVYNQVKNSASKTMNAPIYGFDHNPRMVDVSRMNASAAGVADFIKFKQQSIADFDGPSLGETGTVIVNPPYGERLGDIQRLSKTYKELGSIFKNHFKGWDCWVLSGSAELTKSIGLKATEKHKLFNGPIPCMFLKYSIY